MSVSLAPLNTAPALPIVPAFKVAAIIVLLDVTEPTANEVNVPTLVMLGCAAVLSVPVRTAPVLPIVPAFTVEAINVPVSVSLAPLNTAPALPIVAPCTVVANKVVAFNEPVLGLYASCVDAYVAVLPDVVIANLG